ncbi:MAG TPA: FAD-dependent thymidylate synthase [Nitrospinae bacterium]|nr:FAD-dependent thymidylate synthase [Nitrospinota bacterium]HBA26115.1 FAD-dependent thymidylate synthase [Nitrospinota bacterium]
MKVELLAITPDSEKLIEKAGRTCYLSFDKITADSTEKFIRMLVKSGHESVLEHAYATFRITGGSRAFTHQIVRHRLCSFSQQSQRYVDEKGFEVVTPPSIEKNREAKILFDNFIESAKDTYIRLQSMGIRKEDARFVLPNAVESEIVISANFREWRHVLKERCDKAAQWEIRETALEILKILKNYAPVVFENFDINEDEKTASVRTKT